MWMRGLKVAHGLEVIIEDIGVAFKCFNVAAIGVACMYGCA